LWRQRYLEQRTRNRESRHRRGHAKIALRPTRLLNERGDVVVSIIRTAEQTDNVRAAGAEPIVYDLESIDADELSAAVGSWLANNSTR
jgi:hypothetical protein